MGLSHNCEAQLCTSSDHSWIVVVPSMLQFCDLCHALSVHPANIQQHKLPIHARSFQDFFVCVNIFILLTKSVSSTCLPAIFQFRIIYTKVYVLATSTVISGRVPTVTVHIRGDFIVLLHWEIRSPAPSPDSPLKSHYPDTEQSSPCAILIMPSIQLGSEKYQFYKPLVWLNRALNPRSSACETSALPVCYT